MSGDHDPYNVGLEPDNPYPGPMTNPTRDTEPPVPLTAGPAVIRAFGEDAQSVDLIDALEEHNIYSRGDLERALDAARSGSQAVAGERLEAAGWAYQFAGGLTVAYDFKEGDIVPLLDVLAALANGETPTVEWPAIVPSAAAALSQEASQAQGGPEWPAVDCVAAFLHDHRVAGGFVGPFEGPHSAEAHR